MDLPCAWCSFAGQFDPPSPSTHKYTYVIIIFYNFRTFTFDPFLQVRRGSNTFFHDPVGLLEGLNLDRPGQTPSNIALKRTFSSLEASWWERACVVCHISGFDAINNIAKLGKPWIV